MDDGAGLENKRDEQGRDGMRGRVREPFKLVGIPMLGGERTGAFVPVGNRLAASLTCDASSLEIFGRRGGVIIMWAVRLLRCFAFEWKPSKESGNRTSEQCKTREDLSRRE